MVYFNSYGGFLSGYMKNVNKSNDYVVMVHCPEYQTLMHHSGKINFCLLYVSPFIVPGIMVSEL